MFWILSGGRGDEGGEGGGGGGGVGGGGGGGNVGSESVEMFSRSISVGVYSGVSRISKEVWFISYYQ